MNDPSTLLDEQIRYYRARANEYDQWFLRQGRYDRGPALNRQWFDEVDEVGRALAAFNPAGRVLELAAGTGLWTEQLARHATSITAVDSSPEMLALNRERLGDAPVEYIQADLFSWQPPSRYDVVFFGFWLSHVPLDHFDAFWRLVETCLTPAGRVFFVDSSYDETSTALDHHLQGPEALSVTRRLNDGREFDVVKIFYRPKELAERLTARGWQETIQSTAHYFLYGSGSLVGRNQFVKPTKADVAHQFGRRSHAYATSPVHARGDDLQMLVEMLNLQPDMDVLDVATGAGHTALAVAPHVRCVVATDLAPEMIEQTRMLAAQRDLTNLEALVMDSEALSFPDAAFDAVTCRIAPHHFLDVPAALREIARVLRPGGRFGLEDSIAPPDPALDSFINEVEKLRDPTHVRSYTEAEWRAMLQAADLHVESCLPHRKSHGIPEWIERSDIGPEATARVYEAFAAAPTAARHHFSIHYQNGGATSFTDDKALFRADKRS